MSFLKTTFLLGSLAVLLVGIGFIVGGQGGGIIALIFVGIFNFMAYWYSDKFVLKMYKAKELTKTQNSKLHNIVENLAKKAKLPKPKLYLIEDRNPNAFATGRNPNNAVIAVTSGLLQICNEDEIEGVLAHEFSHIKNRDILIQSIAATIAGAVAWIAHMLWWSSMFGGNRRGMNPVLLLPVIILAPLAATIVRMAISRTREYGADYTGALISKKPGALASALRKISESSKQNPMRHGNRATAHMFIVNPFRTDLMTRIFSTHPDVNSRIERLSKIKV